MTIHQLIYMSEPFGFDDAMLNGILADARRCNARDGLTGALVCRADVYLQLLEGDRDAVQATFARIKLDSRHLAVQHLWDGDVTERMFPDWEMLDDPASSWLWLANDRPNGALRSATPDILRGVFERIAEERA